MIYTAKYSSPLGNILLAEKNGFLIGAWLSGQKYFFATVKEDCTEKETAVLSRAKEWLDDYFAGKKPLPSELPLAPEGSEFRQKVWEILKQIPYGKTVSYGEIANILAKKKGKRVSAQAVGGAVGHNPISVIIPCHRVVGADGSLTGYAGGIDRKVFLLSHEGADMSKIH